MIWRLTKMNDKIKKFLDANIKSYGSIVAPMIIKLVSEDEIPGSLYELSAPVEDGTYINKYLLLTNKQILKIYADKEKINVENIYLKEIIGYKLNIKYYGRENMKYIVEKVEIILKDGILEIEIDENMQHSQSLKEQRSNAIKFIKTLNYFTN